MASWCGHCHERKREVIEPLQEEFGEDRIAIVDVWKNPAIARALNITKVPATYLIDTSKKGAERYQRVDQLARGALEEELKQ